MRVTTTIEKFKSDETDEEISFLVPFFNFFYYLLLIPFKTVLDPETNQYSIKTHALHKILCIFFHAIIEVFMISLWILNGLQFQNNSEPSIITVFDFVSNFCFFITASWTIFILWRRRDKFLQVIESTRVMTKRTNGIKILIYLFTVIASAVWAIINWFTFHHDGRFPSFDSCPMGQNATSTSLHCSIIWGTLLHTGFNILLVHASLFYVVACVSFLVLVFALGQLGKMFRNELEMKIGSKIVDIQKGIELYKALKKKADLVTELFGNGLLSYYITTICYYAEAPYAFLGKRGDTEKATMVYFGCLSVIWILGAEFHRNIQETVLKWISVHTENTKLSVEDRLKLVSLSNEMAADPIAFASKYFCVTYQQFSAMLGLVITYGIIVLQLQNSSTCMESS